MSSSVDSELKTVAYLQRSVLRAMLDEVTPDLRGVCVRIVDNQASCRFLYEGPITDEIRERVDDIETEVIADYLPETSVRCLAMHLPISRDRELGPDEHWAFLRHESPGMSSADAELLRPDYLQWSMQRALLNEVTPDLRGVSVRIVGKQVTCRFLYDGLITDRIAERVEDAKTEIIADYDAATSVRCDAIHLPVEHRRELEPDEYWAYLRYEE